MRQFIGNSQSNPSDIKPIPTVEERVVTDAISCLQTKQNKSYKIVGELRINPAFGTMLIILEDEKSEKSVLRIYSPFLTNKDDTQFNIINRQDNWYKDEVFITSEAQTNNINSLPQNLFSQKIKQDLGEDGTLEISISQMSFVPGEPIQNITTLSESDVLNILSNSFSALSFMHTKGRRHGDIWHNIVYEVETGKGGIIDLVTAKRVQDISEKTNLTLISKYDGDGFFYDLYLASVCKDLSASFRADVISVGRSVISAVLAKSFNDIMEQSLQSVGTRDNAKIWGSDLIKASLSAKGLSKEVVDLLSHIASADPSITAYKCLSASEALEKTRLSISNSETKLIKNNDTTAVLQDLSFREKTFSNLNTKQHVKLKKTTRISETEDRLYKAKTIRALSYIAGISTLGSIAALIASSIIHIPIVAVVVPLVVSSLFFAAFNIVSKKDKAFLEEFKKEKNAFFEAINVNKRVDTIAQFAKSQVDSFIPISEVSLQKRKLSPLKKLGLRLISPILPTSYMDQYSLEAVGITKKGLILIKGIIDKKSAEEFCAGKKIRKSYKRKRSTNSDEIFLNFKKSVLNSSITNFNASTITQSALETIDKIAEYYNEDYSKRYSYYLSRYAVLGNFIPNYKSKNHVQDNFVDFPSHIAIPFSKTWEKQYGRFVKLTFDSITIEQSKISIANARLIDITKGTIDAICTNSGYSYFKFWITAENGSVTLNYSGNIKEGYRFRSGFNPIGSIKFSKECADYLLQEILLSTYRSQPLEPLHQDLFKAYSFRNEDELL